jgi:archaellum component FlaC
MSNEYYSIANNFEKMANTTISDVEAFVKQVSTELNLFKFEKSDKNAEPSLNAQMVIDTITKEARILDATPNLWLGYNAINELIHDKLKKSFDQQHTLDNKVFNHILEMV